MPDTVPVMDPFHVIRLAGDALDGCRRRVQQTHGHRGHRGDPLYAARRTLHTGADLLTDRQWARLGALFDLDDHVQRASWPLTREFVQSEVTASDHEELRFPEFDSHGGSHERGSRCRKLAEIAGALA